MSLHRDPRTEATCKTFAGRNVRVIVWKVRNTISKIGTAKSKLQIATQNPTLAIHDSWLFCLFLTLHFLGGRFFRILQLFLVDCAPTNLKYQTTARYTRCPASLSTFGGLHTSLQLGKPTRSTRKLNQEPLIQLLKRHNPERCAKHLPHLHPLSNKKQQMDWPCKCWVQTYLCAFVELRGSRLLWEP